MYRVVYTYNELYLKAEWLMNTQIHTYTSKNRIFAGIRGACTCVCEAVVAHYPVVRL